MPTYYRLTDIAKHNKQGDLWFIVDRKVYDVTKFADEHPGGPGPLLSVGGDDASNGFKAVGHSDSAKEELYKRCIGEVHPDDVGKLKEPFQGTKSNTASIVLVLMLLAFTFILLLRSLFF